MKSRWELDCIIGLWLAPSCIESSGKKIQKSRERVGEREMKSSWYNMAVLVIMCVNSNSIQSPMPSY